LKTTGPEAGFCDAILTPAPGEITFRRHGAAVRTGGRGERGGVRAAMRLAFERLKVVAEPGGAVALAAALFHGRRWATGP
jgi:threonine dehydratase